ncbi:MAG: hypothetical protein HY231_01985 [Acidobacteria bacterium]|nr:hypothetical protein [Acidobacteriota bacterium]
MSKNIEEASAPNQQPVITQDPLLHKEMVREALLRLREIGKGLPPIDAEALVREGREARDESDHG